MRKLITIPTAADSHASISREANRNNVSISKYILFALFGGEVITATEDNRASDAAYDADKGNTNNGRPQRLNRSLPGKGRNSYLAVRVTEAEHARLRQDARNEGLTVNAYISQALMLPLTN